MLAWTGQAQDDEPARRRGSRIIDDTTKQIYGPRTSKYFYEQDAFMNRTTLHEIDTAIRNVHRFNYIQHYENLYQDLGNIATAMAPIYFKAPETIGVRSGFNGYDLLWEREQVRYFDTKSPYTNMDVVVGGKGRSITRVIFSRNINPRWNAGFKYRGLFIDKTIQRTGKGDRNVVGHYYDFFTTYQSKDSTYRLFFNYRRNNVNADENGGVVSTSSTPLTYIDYFSVNAQPKLTEAASRELRMNFHLFHQYQIRRALQLYHIFDRYRQGNGFFDLPDREPSDAYDYTVAALANDTTADYTKFKTVRNEVGIKGSVGKLFYNGYYALRNYSMTYRHIATDTLKVDTHGQESYLGGRVSLKLDSLVEVTGWAELMQSGNYRLEGHLSSKWFDASLRQMQYTPTFVQQAYRGGHQEWSNDFNNSSVSQLSGNIHYRSKAFSFSPGLTFTRLGNYVYYRYDAARTGQKMLPEQSSGGQVIMSPAVKMSVTTLRHVHLTVQGIYSSVLENTGDAIQIPDLFVNAQLAYENIHFSGNLDMQAGVDVHWKSAYFANGYDVSVQQFYVQQVFQNRAFPLVDLFFNAKIKRARIFVKYNNLMQMITREGYMLTPYYPGQRNVIDFGFDWSFYD